MALASRTTQPSGIPLASRSPSDGTSEAKEQETRAQAMFKRLIRVTTEPAHHDFKANYKIDSDKKKRDFARDVVAMYNGLGDRYEATNGKPNAASYLVIGVKNEQIEGRVVNRLVPLDKRPDHAVYQDVLLKHVSPFIEVLYHDIPWDGGALYGLIEVRRDKFGPAAFYQTISKPGTREVLSRVDGRNVSKKEDSDPTLWERVENLFDQSYDKDCWANLEPALKEGSKGAIHILVTTGLQKGSFSQDTSQGRDLVCMALGSLPWNFVIDLDNESRSEGGLYWRICSHLSSKRGIKPLMYDEVEKNLPVSKVASVHTESDFFNAYISKTFWILANGCKLSGSHSPKKSAQYLIPITMLFSRLFKSIPQPQPVLCVSLITSDEHMSDVPKILERIEESYDNAAENMGDDALTFVNVVTERNFLTPFIGQETDSPRLKASVLPLSHFAPGLLSCYGVDTGIAFITFPSSTGAPATIIGADFVKMSESIEIYHSNYGRIKEDAEGGDDERENDIILKFLQGRQITPEALYIRERGCRQVFVDRSKAVELEKRIRKRLKLRPFYQKKRGTIFTLKHLSSAGGTTAGRSILWKLRNEFPCMEVKSIDENLYTSLKRISEQSGLPLLLLFDRSFLDIDLVEVRNRLSSAVTNAVLLHVCRVTKAQADKAKAVKEDDYTTFVESKLDPHELGGFRELYQVYAQDGSKTKVKKQATKTFLFGLYAFAEQFPKIEEHVVRCIHNCSDQQKAVLRLACLFTRYTERPMLAPLVSLTLDLPVYKNMDDLEVALGEAGEILVPKSVETWGDGFDLPHTCIVDKVWQTAALGFDKNPTSGDLIKLSLDDFRELARHSGVKTVTTAAEWLFLERKSNYFSKFIAQYEKEFDISETSELMSEISDTFKDLPHIRGHYARYLMFNVENGDEAIDQIKRAIGSDCTDSILLSMHGDLVREQLKRQLKSKKAEVPNLLKLATDGIAAYTRSRRYAEKDTKQQVLTYSGEARLRVMLLKHQKKRQLKLDDELLLRDSEKLTIEILDELETMISTQTIPGLNFREIMGHLLTIRIMLFELRQDPTCSPSYLQTHCTTDEEICSLSDVIRARNKEGQLLYGSERKRRSFSELHYHELDLIINKLRMRHESQTIQGIRRAADFNNMLSAMIAIRRFRSDQRERKDLNLDLAIEYAKQWKREYSKDLRPYFLLGVFLFVQALQSKTPRPDLEKDSKTMLEECRKRGRERAHGEELIQGYAKWKYYVGTEPGLAGVMDKHHPMMSDRESGKMLWNARKFKGILQSNGNYVNVSLAGEVLMPARVTRSSRTDSLFQRREQTPPVTFSLVFSYKGIQAVDLLELR